MCCVLCVLCASRTRVYCCMFGCGFNKFLSFVGVTLVAEIYGYTREIREHVAEHIMQDPEMILSHVKRLSSVNCEGSGVYYRKVSAFVAE